MTVPVSCIHRLWCVSEDTLGFAAITNEPPNLKGFITLRFIFRPLSEGVPLRGFALHGVVL